MNDSDIENMSDDEFESAQLSLDEQVENSPQVEEVQAEHIETPIDETEDVSTDEDVSDSEQTEEPVDDEEVVETEEDTPADSETDNNIGSSESQDEDDNDIIENDTQKDFNYESSYKALMEPIKSSGRMVDIKSIDDARKFIGMGISFSQNMKGVKPLRAVGKTLEDAGIIQNGVVDEAKLMRLIDINNGNKDAIAQNIAEHELDPLDIDIDNIQYNQEAKMATEGSVEFEDIEKELLERGGVDNVISSIDRMDAKSKQFFNESPSNLLKLDDDIKSGIYDEIMDTVQYERSLGRLGQLSDMEAYVQLATNRSNANAQQAPEPVQAKSRVNSSKRKAAGISKRAPAKTQKQNTDYVNMSDEEFEKLMPDTQSLY